MGATRGNAALAGEATRVLIIDDHVLLARLLARSLDDEGFLTRAVTGDDLVDASSIAREFRPDVCLLDKDLGPAGDGCALIEPLVDVGSKVLLLTACRDDAAKGEALEAGALSAVSKDEPLDKLVTAITNAVADNGNWFVATQHRCLGALRERRHEERERLAPFASLTPRERQVLAELSGGRSAKAIAEDAYVSLSTVRSQIRSILTKLGVSSQMAAVARAHEAGWS